MKFWGGMGGDRIWLGAGDDLPKRLTPSPTASQTSPRRNYVYGHFDKSGVPFYIGKGTRRRAWDGDRDPLWHRYVEKHLRGEYSVVILADDLTSEQAEDLEGMWMAQESQTLVNWINFARKQDFDALDRYHTLRDKNRKLASEARGQERSNLTKAIDMYFQALANIEAYATIQTERGLVGMLIDEERRDFGIRGDLEILDRLSLCLVRAGRGSEAVKVAMQYFERYRADQSLRGAERIKKRVGKAAANGA